MPLRVKNNKVIITTKPLFLRALKGLNSIARGNAP